MLNFGAFCLMLCITASPCSRQQAIVACSQAIDTSEYSHNRNEMKRTSFWLPEFTPGGGAAIVPKVKKEM
jgi:hypothetical protein